MTFADSMQRVTTSAVLSSRALTRLAARLCFSERFLERVFQEQTFSNGITLDPRAHRLLLQFILDSRFLADPEVARYVAAHPALVDHPDIRGALTDRLIAHPGLSDHIRRNEDALRHLAAQEWLVSRILEQETIGDAVSENERFVNALLGNAAFVARIVERFAADLSFLERLVACPGAVEAIGQAFVDTAAPFDGFLSDAVVQRIVADERVRRRAAAVLLQDEKALAQFVKSPEIVGPILSARVTLEALTDEAKFFEFFVNHPAAFDRLFETPNVLDRVFEKEERLARVARDERVVDRVINDVVSLDKVLVSTRAFHRILGNVAHIQRFALSDSFAAALYEQPAFLQRFFAQPGFVDRIAETPHLLAALVENERFLAAAAQREAFVERLLSQPAARDRFLSAPRRLRDVVRDDRVLHAVLHDPDAFAALLARSEKMAADLAERAVVFNQIVEGPLYERLIANPDFRRRLLGEDRVIGDIVNDPDLLNRLVTSENVVERASLSDTFLGKFLLRDRVLDRIVADPRVLTRVLSDRRTFEMIVADDVLLTKAASHPRVFEKILADDSLLTRMISRGRVVEKFAADSVNLQRLLIDPQVFERALTIESFVDKLLASGAVLNRIVDNKDLLQRIFERGKTLDVAQYADWFIDKLLEGDRVVRRIQNDDKIVARIFAHGEAQKFAYTPERLKTYLFKHHQVLDEVLADPAVFDRRGRVNILRARLEFDQAWERLKPFVRPDAPGFGDQLRKARARVNTLGDVADALLDIITRDNRLRLAHGEMEFPDRHSAWVLLQEILFGQEHYFESDTGSPRIIDCGAHFGLAVYYFKTLYPNARVIAFEPVPALRKLLEKNIKRNRFKDVSVLPFAVSDIEGPAKFIVSRQDSMAGSLTERRRQRGDEVAEIDVECKKLSEFLGEPTHFLKIDIEGAEDRVIEEAAPKLHNVQHLFCEFHHDAGEPSARLAAIFRVLSDAGFEVRIGQAEQIAAPASHLKGFQTDRTGVSLWAKNIRWGPPGDSGGRE